MAAKGNPVDVEPLPGTTPPPEIVESCEWLLEQAKAGRLRGLAFALVWPDGTPGTGFPRGDCNSVVLLGGLTLLQDRFIATLESLSIPDAEGIEL